MAQYDVPDEQTRAITVKRFRRIGRGVYSAVEIERLTGVPARSIRRWTRGYTYQYGDEIIFSEPVIGDTAIDSTGQPILTFADMVEVRFLHAFRKHGVGWKTIRIAARRAKELLGRHHPFSTRIFKTDGQSIIAEISRETGDKLLLDLVRNQFEFEKVVAPFLYTGLEFDASDEAFRWWPLGEDRRIVIDPERAFGAPIVASEAVPTRTLYLAYQAEDDEDFVADWFEVSPAAVRDAIAFESGLTT